MCGAQVISNTNLYILWGYAPQPGTTSSKRITVSYVEHTNYGTGLVNFFNSSAAATGSSNGLVPFALDPGQLLLVLVLSIFCFAAVIHNTWLLVKAIRQSFRRTVGAADWRSLPASS